MVIPLPAERDKDDTAPLVIEMPLMVLAVAPYEFSSLSKLKKKD